MTNSLGKLIAIACAVIALHLITLAPAAAQSTPLALQPQAQSAPKVKRAAPAKVHRQVDRQVDRQAKAPFRSPAWYTYREGNPDLAFMSAGQYLDLASVDAAMPVVDQNELSILDLAAGGVRVVSPDEVNEIDLANEPAVRIAQRADMPQAQSAQEASAVTAKSENGEEDDGILNRILMTFAGALAMASAMRMILA